MADFAYRSFRALLYISGSHPHSIGDDKVNESAGHGLFSKWGIEEFDEEESELEKKLT